jgi:hypothetical protein
LAITLQPVVSTRARMPRANTATIFLFLFMVVPPFQMKWLFYLAVCSTQRRHWGAYKSRR